MKHFKHIDGRVFAFELDGSQDHLISEDMTEMTEAELTDHRKPRIKTEKELALQELQATDKDMATVAEEAIEILDGLIQEISPTHDVKSRLSQKTKDLLTKRKNARAKLKGE